MYLKAIEIQGFKSFAEKTRLSFEHEITAIVGPNGSGKSNISDAIRWVMGEQSSKTLRGAKMTDVIFGGTASRAAMGFAKVALIIDNSTRLLDVDTDEVTLTRKYYRSGDSEFYINHEQVRLRDINELLMDTGMGRDGYSIIGQGRIAEIVSGKSDGRREVIEEAVGISRFRYRKEEAERRLKRTEENLLRVKDKIDELELSINPLREQSEIAKRYLVLRDELRGLEVSLWMDKLDNLRAQAADIVLAYEQAKKSLECEKMALNDLYALNEDYDRKNREQEVALENLRQQQSKFERDLAEQKSKLAVLVSNVKNNEETAKRAKDDLIEQQKRDDEISLQIKTHDEDLISVKAKVSSLNDKLSIENKKLSELSEILAKNKSENAKLTNEHTQKMIDLRSLESKISMLTEMEKDYEGFSRAVKRVMREAKSGRLAGIHGTVADLIKTEDKTSLAIETALAAAISNIVVDTQNDAKAAIEYLKRNETGRATFLPIETIRGSVLNYVPKGEGIVGLAVDLVSFDEQYRDIMESLLGKTIITKTLSDAINLSKNQNIRAKLVSLDGQVINAGGSMTGGSNSKGSGILSRANELEKLKKSKDTKERALQDLEKRLVEENAGLEKLLKIEQNINLSIQRINHEKLSFEAELRSLDALKKQLQIMRQNIKNDLERGERLAKSMLEQANNRASLIAGCEAEIEKFKISIEETKNEISEAMAKKMELEGKRNRNSRNLQDTNTKLLNMERSVSSLAHKKETSDLEERQIVDKLWDSYELSHSEAMKIRQVVEKQSETARKVSKLRSEMQSLGNPNIGAIEEFERVNERYEFLVSQRDDVETAKRDIDKIIFEIVTEMEAIFKREFSEINKCFTEVFKELFGGGTASLVLEDGEDVLNSDIEIVVSPPGKAVSNISLLSGGEMAFVAIALYFAIIRVRPSPFCVMDEIEAALDEANVERYGRYMQKISHKTQFILITHRRGTMEIADEIYGVTMQEKGVSKVIGLDMTEAKKHIGDK